MEVVIMYVIVVLVEVVLLMYVTVLLVENGEMMVVVEDSIKSNAMIPPAPHYLQSD